MVFRSAKAHATALVEAGVDLSVVKDLLGRESFRCSPSGEATQL